MKSILIKINANKINIKNEDLEKYFNDDKSIVNFNLLEANFKYLKILVEDSHIDLFISKVLALKLNDNFVIKNKKINIDEIKVVSNFKLKSELKNNIFDIKNKKINLFFKTPVIFKIGYSFWKNFSITIFFLLVLRQYNRNTSKENKINLNMNELEKIIIEKNNLENFDFKIENELINSFIGNILLNFDAVEESELQKYQILLNYMKRNKIGYKKEKKYGEIKVTLV